MACINCIHTQVPCKQTCKSLWSLQVSVEIKGTFCHSAKTTKVSIKLCYTLFMGKGIYFSQGHFLVAVAILSVF